MWVNSKTAAAVLSVGDRAIQKAVLKAITIGKNFCVVKSNKINFTYLNGIGRGGKVLQIWIDDSVIAEFEATNGVRVSINGIIQGSKCVDLHGIWGEIPQESQNLANSPCASFNNGSLNTGDCFETHGVSRNDNKNSLGGASMGVGGAVGGQGGYQGQDFSRGGAVGGQGGYQGQDFSRGGAVGEQGGYQGQDFSRGGEIVGGSGQGLGVGGAEFSRGGAVGEQGGYQGQDFSRGGEIVGGGYQGLGVAGEMGVAGELFGKAEQLKNEVEISKNNQNSEASNDKNSKNQDIFRENDKNSKNQDIFRENDKNSKNQDIFREREILHESPMYSRGVCGAVGNILDNRSDFKYLVGADKACRISVRESLRLYRDKNKTNIQEGINDRANGRGNGVGEFCNANDFGRTLGGGRGECDFENNQRYRFEAENEIPIGGVKNGHRGVDISSAQCGDDDVFFAQYTSVKSQSVCETGQSAKRGTEYEWDSVDSAENKLQNEQKSTSRNREISENFGGLNGRMREGGDKKSRDDSGKNGRDREINIRNSVGAFGQDDECGARDWGLENMECHSKSEKSSQTKQKQNQECARAQSIYVNKSLLKLDDLCDFMGLADKGSSLAPKIANTTPLYQSAGGVNSSKNSENNQNLGLNVAFKSGLNTDEKPFLNANQGENNVFDSKNNANDNHSGSYSDVGGAHSASCGGGCVDNPARYRESDSELKVSVVGAHLGENNQNLAFKSGLNADEKLNLNLKKGENNVCGSFGGSDFDTYFGDTSGVGDDTSDKLSKKAINVRSSDSSAHQRLGDERALDISHEVAKKGSQKAKRQSLSNRDNQEPKNNINRVVLLKSTAGRMAINKEKIIFEYQKNSLNLSSFCEKMSVKFGLVVNKNKLFDWLKKYKKNGIFGLIDTRGGAKKSVIATLGLKDECEEQIKATQKECNYENIAERLNEILAMRENKGEILLNTYKKQGVITARMVEIYAKKWRNSNKITNSVRCVGVDKTISHHMPAVGKADWAVTSINQVVEIDASPLDIMVSNSDLARVLGIDEEAAKRLQARFSIICLIDVYSKVRVYEVCQSENKIAVQRAIAKYILRYGKPQKIHGDNGKAFLSLAVQEALTNLGIPYEKAPAYSGWKKPYVERSFGTLQRRFSESFAAYIGANVAERMALEDIRPLREKRMHKGDKTRLENLESVKNMRVLLDDFTEYVINNTATGKGLRTPKELYEERMSEAVAMNEYEVHALIGGMIKRSVNKKGISFNGEYYAFSGAFNYKEVKISENLDDSSKLYVFDMEHNFIALATSTKAGVSKEMAANEQKAFRKVLKESQNEVLKARQKVGEKRKAAVAFAKEKLPTIARLESAKSKAGEDIKIAVEKVANLGENLALSDEILESVNEKGAKKTLDFSDFVLGVED